MAATHPKKVGTEIK